MRRVGGVIENPNKCRIYHNPLLEYLVCTLENLVHKLINTNGDD
jgi:hypothetical protein